MKEEEKKELSVETVANVDWSDIEAEVSLKIRAIAALAQMLPDLPEELGKKIANQSILPVARILAEFCVAVEISEGDEEGTAGCSIVLD